MSFLEIFKLIVSILPLLIEAIKQIEKAMPGKGSGEAKLETVRVILEQAHQLSSPGQSFDSVWPALKNVIEGIVRSFNTTGIFK